MQGGGSAALLRLEGGSTRRDAGTQPRTADGARQRGRKGHRVRPAVLIVGSRGVRGRGGGARKLESIRKFGNVYRSRSVFPPKTHEKGEMRRP